MAHAEFPVTTRIKLGLKVQENLSRPGDPRRYVDAYLEANGETVAFNDSRIDWGNYERRNWFSVFAKTIVVGHTHYSVKSIAVETAKSWLEAQGFEVHDQREKEAA